MVRSGPSGTRGPTVRTLSLPVPPWVFSSLVNQVVSALLRSPFHRLVSHSVLLLTYTGRRSGREYSTPVGYEQVDGVLYLTSRMDRTWWRNLRGGAPVTVHRRGERRTGTATVTEDDRAVAAYVAGYVDRHGRDGLRRLAIAIDGDELPDTATLAAGLGAVVVVRIELTDDPGAC